MQAFEPADPGPGQDPGMDPNLAYDTRDLYPYSPWAEPTAYPQTASRYPQDAYQGVA